MKLISLEFQAFGAFKEKQIINFEELKNEGLFLISGKTGSGKSTIFDALSYALYGERTGERKNNTSEIKSHYADENTKCYVSLTFIVNDTLYTVTREPAQTIIGKSGKSKKTTASKVLSYNDITLDKESDINNKITHLIGLDATQFKQIIMLQQGKFQQLLLSSSNEKEAIFTKILDTSVYQDIGLEIKSKFDVISKEHNKLHDKIDDILDNYTEAEDKDHLKKVLDSNISKYKQNIKDISKEIKDIEQIINKDNISLSSLSKDNKMILKYKESIAILSELASNSDNIKKLYKDLELAISTKSFIEKEKHIKTIKSSIDETIKDISIKSSTLEGYNKSLKEIPKSKDLELLSKELSDQEKILEELNNTKVMFSEYDTLEKNVINKKETFNKVSLKKQESEKNYEDVHNKYLSNISFLLASELKDNKPCPVCGSTTHPNKSNNESELVTKETLDKANKLREEHIKEYNTINNELTTLATKQQSKREELEKYYSKYNIDSSESFNKKLNDVNTLISSLKDEIKVTKENNSKRDKLNDLISKLSGSLDTLKVSKESLSSEFKKEHKEFEKAINSQYGDLQTYKDSKLLDSKILDQEIKSYEDKKLLAETFIKENDAYKDKEVVDTKSLEDSLNKNNEIKESKLNKSIEYTRQLSICENDLKVLEGTLKSLDSISNDFKNITVLHKLFLGDYTNRTKLNSLILSYYFDEILLIANENLKHLTDNRFILFRVKPTSVKGQGYKGLDIEILDNNTSTKRGIKSISGGEQFKVSLSLALALSQYIQSKNSKFSLENVFIDEGFGTLDPESLDSTIDLLMNLQSEGKIIGIISHVSALKEQIQKQIVVTSSNSGSKLTVL